VASRAAKKPSVTAEQKVELLRLLGIGLEFRTACEKAKVSVAAVQQDATLYGEALEAFRLGIARLRERAVELTFDKNATAGSRAVLLDRIMNRRDAELARLAAAPQPPEAVTKSTDDLLETIVGIFERWLEDKPLELLPRFIAVATSTGKLSAEAVEAGQAFVALLGSHPPLKYSAEWWAAERAAGRNGYCQVTPPAKPAAPEPEVIPPERLKVLDATQSLPSNRAPAVRTRVPPVPPAVSLLRPAPAKPTSRWVWVLPPARKALRSPSPPPPPSSTN
jgi:hypothetical protein